MLMKRENIVQLCFKEKVILEKRKKKVMQKQCWAFPGNSHRVRKEEMAV